MLLIWLLGLLWFSNDNDTCVCKGYLSGVNISITFFFWRQHPLKLEYKLLGDGWKLFVNNFVEKIFLLCTSCRYILLFSYIFFFIVEYYFQCKSVTKKKKILLKRKKTLSESDEQIQLFGKLAIFRCAEF